MSFLHLKRAVVALAAIALTASVGTTGARAEHVPNCNDRGSNFARFLQPKSGQATVNAGPAGTYTLSTGGPVPSVTLSFTGSMDVVIEHSCLRALSLDVYKDGSTTPIHHADFAPECAHTTTTEPVTIGLDGGSYSFVLGGTSCTGIGFKNTPEGGLVGDPPLL